MGRAELQWRPEAPTKLAFWQVIGTSLATPEPLDAIAILQPLWPRGHFVGVVLFDPHSPEPKLREESLRLGSLYPSDSGLHAPVPITGWTALGAQLAEWGSRFPWHLFACDEALRDRHAVSLAYDARLSTERRWGMPTDDDAATDRFLRSLLDRHPVIARARGRTNREMVVDCASPIPDSLMASLPGRRFGT